MHGGSATKPSAGLRVLPFFPNYFLTRQLQDPVYPRPLFQSGDTAVATMIAHAQQPAGVTYYSAWSYQARAAVQLLPPTMIRSAWLWEPALASRRDSAANANANAGNISHQRALQPRPVGDRCRLFCSLRVITPGTKLCSLCVAKFFFRLKAAHLPL